MRTHHLLILIAAAVVAILAAVWARSVHEPAHTVGTGTLLVPGLEAKLNDVTTLSVKGKDGTTVTLDRGTDSWSVRERSGYPADTAKVRKLLIGIAQAKLLEPKTANAESYGELGVADPTTAAASPPASPEKDKSPAKPEATSGALVELQAPIEGQDKVALIIGNSARGATSTYVRKVGDAQSWLASGDLSVAADPMTWVDRTIMNVAANRIQQVSIRHPDGQTLVIDKAKKDDANFTVHDIPDKREVKYASIGNPTASALASLRFDDVATLADKDPSSHSPLVAEYRTFDGMVVTLQAYADGDKRYAHFTAAFDEDQARRFYVPPAPAADPAKPDDATSDAAKDPTAGDEAAEAAKPAGETPATSPGSTASVTPAAPAEPDFSAVRTEVDTLAKKVQPWVYDIGSYKYDQINKHVTDMLKDVETKDQGAAKKPDIKKPAPKKPESQTPNQ
jgi:hypothetical protein